MKQLGGDRDGTGRYLARAAVFLDRHDNLYASRAASRQNRKILEELDKKIPTPVQLAGNAPAAAKIPRHQRRAAELLSRIKLENYETENTLGIHTRHKMTNEYGDPYTYDSVKKLTFADFLKVEKSSGRSNLVNNVSKQVKKRAANLPAGTKQTIVIDVRGQNVSNKVLKSIRSRILKKSGISVKIIFKR